MRDLWLVLAAGGVACAATAVACGSDVTQIPNNAAGGSSAQSTASSTQGSASVTASSSSSGGGLCDQACAKLEDQCGYGEICQQIPFLDCNDPESECPAQCVLDAECQAIISYVSGTPDPEFAGCIDECLGEGGGSGQSCPICVATNCQAEVQACQSNPQCQPLIGCVLGCEDEQCIKQCAAEYPTAETDAIFACGCEPDNCAAACGAACDRGGAGGAGGAGGTGGNGGGA